MLHMSDWRALLRREAPPRTHADAAFLAKYNRFAQPLIVAAAILPLVVDTRRHQAAGIIVGVGSWLVFVVDFVVQSRRRERYLHSGMGVFDLVIVVVTSPWYLIPGVNAGAIVSVLRLARLARILMVFHGARRLLERLGRAALVAVVVVLAFSWVAYDAENEVNREFASYGDSVWWGIVTLTTVGYGDIVPITLVGRYAGVVIMVMGVGLLGVLAGALASFFKLSPKEERQDAAAAESERRRESVTAEDATAEDGDRDAAGAGEGTGATAGSMPPDTADIDAETPASSADIAALTQQVVDLRQQIAGLADQLRAVGPDSSTDSDGTTDASGAGGP